MDAGHSDRKNVRSTSISCLLPSLNDLKGSDTFVSYVYLADTNAKDCELDHIIGSFRCPFGPTGSRNRVGRRSVIRRVKWLRLSWG